MTDLLDLNVWMALVDERHVHHALAQSYWSENGATHFGFCRITMLGFLRLATNPKAVQNPKSPREAWAVYSQFLIVPNVCFLAEPTGLDNRFEVLTTETALPHRLWTDAYLAAFALAGGYRLVSFDANFSRFPGLHRLHLAP